MKYISSVLSQVKAMNQQTTTKPTNNLQIDVVSKERNVELIEITAQKKISCPF